MRFSKEIVVIVYICLVQNFHVQAYTLVGLGTRPNSNPKVLVSITSSCSVEIIAPFTFSGNIYGGSNNVGAVDANGNYYANFLRTSTQWWGPASTFTINLNDPSSGWTSYGTTAVYAVAVNTAGEVYGIGTNESQGCIGIRMDASQQSEDPFGYFPADSVPAGGAGATIDGAGNIWANIYQEISISDYYDYFYGMNTDTGKINYRVTTNPGNYPDPIDIHWDSQTSTFYSICQLSEYTYGMCKIYPETNNDVVVYGSSIFAAFIFSGGTYSPSDRILYVQLNINESILNTNLVGFDIDTGAPTYNCVVPTSTGGTLVDLALWP